MYPISATSTKAATGATETHEARIFARLDAQERQELHRLLRLVWSA